jgi:hypothetical protein
VGSTWDTLKKTSKNCRKLNSHFLWLFFPQTLCLFKSSHIPVDRAWLALQNCIYDISPQSWFDNEKIKKQRFFAHRISCFFSVFWPNTYVRNLLPKKLLHHFVAHLILHRIIYQTLFHNVQHPRWYDSNIDLWHHICPTFGVITDSYLQFFFLNFFTVQIESYTNR